MKIRTSFKNPSIDFFIKSYIFLLVTPYLLSGLSIIVMIFLGGDLFKQEGVLMAYIWGFYLGVFVYGLSIILCTVIIALFNKKLMSGDRVPKFNKFPRLTLFALSFLAYLVTMYVVGWFLR